eukprot:gene11374-12071_t
MFALPKANSVTMTVPRTHGQARAVVPCSRKFGTRSHPLLAQHTRARSGLVMPSAVTQQIGFLGGGMMANALIRGFIDKGVLAADQIRVYDPKQANRDKFESLGAKSYPTNTEVVENSDMVFLCVKPAVIPKVLTQIKPYLTPDKVIVSVAAGVPISKLVEHTGPDYKIIRVMPNTPVLVGETAAAMCLGGTAGQEEEAILMELFSAVGKIYTLDESKISAVTGTLAAQTVYGASKMVLETVSHPGVLETLAAQTVFGASKMVLETGSHPGVLKDMVTSPGGTTIAAVHELEKCGMRAAFMNAVTAAAARADEIAEM